MIGSLLKAAVGVVMLPVSVASDIVTMGGELSDSGESAIVRNCRNIGKNLDNAVKPDSDDD